MVQTGTPAPSDRVTRRCGPVRTTQLHVPTLFFLPAAKSRGLHLPSPACAGLVFAAGQVSLAQAKLCNCCPRLQPPGVIVALPPIRFMSADRQQSCVMSKLNVTGIGSTGAPVRPGVARPGDARPGVARPGAPVRPGDPCGQAVPAIWWSLPPQAKCETQHWPGQPRQQILVMASTCTISHERTCRHRKGAAPIRFCWWLVCLLRWLPSSRKRSTRRNGAEPTADRLNFAGTLNFAQNRSGRSCTRTGRSSGRREAHCRWRPAMLDRGCAPPIPAESARRRV